MPKEKHDKVSLHIAILVPTPIYKARMVRAANIEGRSLNNWFTTTGWKAMEPAIIRAEMSSESPADREPFTDAEAERYLEKYMGNHRKGSRQKIRHDEIQGL